MTKPPLGVIIVGCLFVAAGAAGLIYHFRELKPAQPFHYDILWISLVRLLAIVAGAFMLLGHNWARWLGLAWMAFHVVISAFHPFQEFAIHAALLVVIAYLLFRREANLFFGEKKSQAS